MNKRKIGRFIFYFLGLAAPYIFAYFFYLSIEILSRLKFYSYEIGRSWILIYLILSFFIIKKSLDLQFISYKMKGGKRSKENINQWSIIYWIFSFLLWICIIIPLFLGRPSDVVAYSRAIQNSLLNGVKECVVLNSDNQTTRFADVQSFPFRNSKFKIQPLDPNSCFKAKAVPTNNQNTWFQIDLNMETGEVAKTCGDSSKPGCNEGNTW